jgi:hypothetical protein
MKRELRRALAFGRNIESNDRVADSEFGEELGHGLVLVATVSLSGEYPD